MNASRWFWPLVLFTGAGLLLAAAPQSQSTPPDSKDHVLPPIVKAMNVKMEILINGQLQPFVYWKGKTYLPVAQWGAAYEIRIQNNSVKRITAIISVDGLSVITLKPASEKQPGYVIAPHTSAVIKGWRKNDDTVAAFTFVDREQSYASQIGHPENIGVIGLVAFEELSFPPNPPIESKYAGGTLADAAGSKAAPAPGAFSNIGTGYGKTIYSPTYEVPFVRNTNKSAITIYYDTVAALRDMGVPVDPMYPNPFPADPKLTP